MVGGNAGLAGLSDIVLYVLGSRKAHLQAYVNASYESAGCPQRTRIPWLWMLVTSVTQPGCASVSSGDLTGRDLWEL